MSQVEKGHICCMSPPSPPNSQVCTEPLSPSRVRGLEGWEEMVKNWASDLQGASYATVNRTLGAASSGPPSSGPTLGLDPVPSPGRGLGTSQKRPFVLSQSVAIARQPQHKGKRGFPPH